MGTTIETITVTRPMKVSSPLQSPSTELRNLTVSKLFDHASLPPPLRAAGASSCNLGPVELRISVHRYNQGYSITTLLMGCSFLVKLCQENHEC